LWRVPSVGEIGEDVTNVMQLQVVTQAVLKEKYSQNQKRPA